MTKILPPQELISNVHRSPGFLLWQVEMCWQRVINKVLTGHDLTYTQFIVLSITGWLSENNAPVYQHQIAKHSKIDRMMTSRILASLEKKGFITRLKIDGDARAKLVDLTSRGKKVLELSLAEVNEMEARFFKPGDKNFVDSMDDILSDCENL